MRSIRDTGRAGALAALTAFILALGAVRGASAFCTSEGRVKVAVKFSPPPGKDIAGVKVVLDYPEKSITIPGFENQPEVKARIAEVPPTFLSAPNDTDTELIMAIAGMNVLPAATIFTADFDRCKGEPAVRVADFHCEVKEASTPQGNLVDGSTCTVEIESKPTADKAANLEQSKTERGDSL